MVGGTTLSEGSARDRFSGVELKATYEAGGPTPGACDDDVSFKPDTIFGLEI